MGGLVLVGAFTLRSSLLAAVAAIGAFAFLASVAPLLVDGEQGRSLWRTSAAVSLRGVAIALALVGTLVALAGLHLMWGVLTVFLAWLAPWRRFAAASGPARAAAADAAASASASASEEAEDSDAGGSGSPGNADPPTATDLDALVQSFSRTPIARVRSAVRAGGTKEAEAVVRSFDDRALWRAWTQARMVDGSDPTRVAELTAVRAALLDEMERRDPAAFQAWLARGVPDDPPVPH